MANFLMNRQQINGEDFDVRIESMKFLPDQKCVRLEGVKRHYNQNDEIYHLEAFLRVDRNEPEQTAPRYVYGDEQLEEYKIDEQTQEIIEPDEIITIVTKEADPKFDNWCTSLEPILIDKL